MPLIWFEQVLGDYWYYWGTTTSMWAMTVIRRGVIGRDGLPNLNPSGGILC